MDGPRLNPDLEDGLGHFRVKHFALASKNNRTFEIILNISDIVSQNQDIKVWNLSLGSDFEIDDNYISVLGSILDSLQTKYDVIFVIAGTNRAKTRLTHNTILTRAHEIDKDLAKVESNDTDVILMTITKIMNQMVNLTLHLETLFKTKLQISQLVTKVIKKY